MVIYEENHSFDNLFGGWEGVNGLNNVHQTGVGDHVTQVDQNGAAYGCLKQLDVNLTSPPLANTCQDTTHGITASNFPNPYFTIDDFIKPTDVTCPPITNAFGFANGIDKNNPPAGARPGGCTRDLVHEYYQEQYQLHGGAAGPLHERQRLGRHDDGRVRHDAASALHVPAREGTPALRDRRRLLPGGVRRVVPQPPVADRRGDAGRSDRLDGRCPCGQPFDHRLERDAG